MELKGYRIVLLGIHSGQDRRQVVGQLAQTFRCPPEEIERLLANAPVVVRSNLDRRTAARYREVIAQAGATSRIEALEKPEKTAEEAPPQTAAPAKTCPACGYRAATVDDPLLKAHGDLGECPSCGIVVSKYNQAKRPVQTAPRLSPATGKPKKRSIWFWLGGVAAILAGLVILGAIAQFTLCKISLSRFMARVQAFDQKGYSLDSQENLIAAIEGLHRLYNAAAESNPLFSWRRFNPDGRFGKFYTEGTVATLMTELATRREALINAMGEAAEDGQLFNYPVERINKHLEQFEYCIIRKLERMTSRRRDIQASLENLRATIRNAQSCRGFLAGPLPERLEPEYYGVFAAKMDRGSGPQQPIQGSYADVMKERGPILNGLRKLQVLRDNWRDKNRLGRNGFPTREEIVADLGEFAWPGSRSAIPGAEFFFLADGTPACLYKGKTFTQKSRDLHGAGNF